MSDERLLSVSDIVKFDHRELEQYYDNIVNATDERVQERYQNILIWELARHCIGEDIILYPAIAANVKDGMSVVARHRLENQKLMDTLRLLQKLRPGDSKFHFCIQALFTDLKKRIKEEDTQDLIRLEQALGHQQSHDLASEFQRTKGFVPVRRHPMSSEKPPFETLEDLLTAPIDKLAKLLRLSSDE